MARTTVTSRQFNQDTQGAKRAARNGPVFITDRGRPSYVLLTIEEYVRITGGRRKIADALALRQGSRLEFDPPRVSIQLRPADLP